MIDETREKGLKRKKQNLLKFFRAVYSSEILSKIFHNQLYCLKRDLSDCESVLDLGCGVGSPIQYSKNIKYSVGVEAFKPYYDESVRNKIHSECINKKINEVDFDANSFDAVMMIGVLEHLTKEEGLETLAKCEKWAKKKVIIATPNGFLPQHSIDGNEHQCHLSGWDVMEYRKMGYKVYGMSGAKYLCHEVDVDTVLEDSGDVFFSCVKYKPKALFYIINALHQMCLYYFPRFSFGLLSVKKL